MSDVNKILEHRRVKEIEIGEQSAKERISSWALWVPVIAMWAHPSTLGFPPMFLTSQRRMRLVFLVYLDYACADQVKSRMQRDL